jgi:hypothetical protein
MYVDAGNDDAIVGVRHYHHHHSEAARQTVIQPVSQPHTRPPPAPLPQVPPCAAPPADRRSASCVNTKGVYTVARTVIWE